MCSELRHGYLSPIAFGIRMHKSESGRGIGGSKELPKPRQRQLPTPRHKCHNPIAVEPSLQKMVAFFLHTAYEGATPLLVSNGNGTRELQSIKMLL